MYQFLNDEFEKVTRAQEWQERAVALVDCECLPDEYQSRFHIYWTVAGHHIREQIDNDVLLSRVLAIALPKYHGESKILYRGENLARWNNKRIGFCWSDNIETARMFGRGLNATNSGGVLLRIRTDDNVIIAGPSTHSKYLGESEYTIDPFKIQGGVEALEFYPSWS